MKTLIGDYETFISTLSPGLAAIGIHRSELAMLDHICYRVATQERYESMLTRLKAVTLFLGEAEVSGRAIATFEFKDFLHVDGWIVPYLELPAPKPGSPYQEGLEHAEFVIHGGLDRFAKNHPKVTFETKGLTKTINPELGLKTKLLSVKFHEQPLGAVVRIEQRLVAT